MTKHDNISTVVKNLLMSGTLELQSQFSECLYFSDIKLLCKQQRKRAGKQAII